MNLLNQLVAANSLTGAKAMSTGETILAVVLAVVVLGCALAVAFSRKTVHAAVYMVGVMLALAMIYFALDAEFLGAVQIVVYTGAIMMLFLFVIMLVGVRAVDSPRESQTLQVASAALLSLAMALVTITAVVRTFIPPAKGLAEANKDTNPTALARLLFNEHYFAIELVGTLLVIAALGAMALTHSDRLLPKISQSFLAEQKMQAFAQSGLHPAPKTMPGVYATSNALDVPALSGQTGQPIAESIPRILQAHGEGRSVGEVAPWSARAARSGQLHGSASPQPSGQWSMPGPQAPQITQYPGSGEPDLEEPTQTAPTGEESK